MSTLIGALASTFTGGAAAAASLPLMLASVLNRGPYALQATGGVAVIASDPAQTDYLIRTPFIIGSTNFSSLVISNFAWYNTHAAGGCVASGNSFSIEEAALECNSTYTPILFSGARNKTVASGDNDIQSDAILPAAVGLASFTRGTTGWIRMRIRFSTPGATNYIPVCDSYAGADVFGLLYDTSAVSPANGVDGTGAMTTSGGSSSNKRITGAHYKPLLLGIPTAAAKAWFLFGDSKTYGTNDTYTSIGVGGITRAMLPNSAAAADGFACCNMGSPSGSASNLAGGTPAFFTNWLQYGNSAIEMYGTNSVNAAASQAVHAQLRAGGITKIIRTSLTPNTSGTCPMSITGITRVGTLATATVSAGVYADLIDGQAYPISGASPSQYNGTYTITKIGGNQFTYTMASDPGSSASGTIIANDRWRTLNYQTPATGWSVGGAVNTFETAMAALVANDLTYCQMEGMRAATSGADYWKWTAGGTTPNFHTADGLHQSATGYEATVAGNSTVTVFGQSPVTQSLRALVASLA